MLYFCADTRSATVTPSIDNSGNFLHAAMTEAKMKLQTMDLLPGSITDLNVIVLYDYPYTFQDPNGHAMIYQLRTTADGGNTQEAAWGAVNMGHPDTLSDFVAFCKTNFPANNYALVLSDHGRGYAGYCYDYHAPHPYWPYAIGDCLSVPELETALSGANNVDVLIFNTCLGASFETSWQLVGEVSYIVAGESTQGASALHHPREIAYALSRDLTMTPKELAQAAYNGAVDPVVLPSYYDWSTISLIDLTKFDITVGVPSFMETFDDFTQKLVDEIDYSSSTMIPYFKNFRGNLTSEGLATSESMMVDLTNFIEEIVANKTDLHYTETGDLATTLLTFLAKNSNGLLVNESHASYYDEYMNGFSLCFPDSYDMYKGFMYPNLYENFKISIESSWWEFIGKLYPLLSFEKFKLKDFYEIQLLHIDPSIRLDVFINPFEGAAERHVGLNDDFAEVNMGVELGIEGAEYHDDLIGNVMIRIPTASVQISKATGDENFRVVINATSAASASQIANLTVKHVMNNEVVWQESQQSAIEVGQQLSCDVSTDDEMTDFEVEQIWTNTSENTAFIGPKKELTLTTIIFSMTIIIAIVYRKKVHTKKHGY